MYNVRKNVQSVLYHNIKHFKLIIIVYIDFFISTELNFN